jgi:hypothetical protein
MFEVLDVLFGGLEASPVPVAWVDYEQKYCILKKKFPTVNFWIFWVVKNLPIVFPIKIVFFVKVDLARERAADLAVLTEDEYQKVFIFYASFIQVCP